MMKINNRKHSQMFDNVANSYFDRTEFHVAIDFR